VKHTAFFWSGLVTVSFLPPSPRFAVYELPLRGVPDGLDSMVSSAGAALAPLMFAPAPLYMFE